MESTLVQADSDVAEVIKEYNRDTVAFFRGYGREAFLLIK